MRNPVPIPSDSATLVEWCRDTQGCYNIDWGSRWLARSWLLNGFAANGHNLAQRTLDRLRGFFALTPRSPLPCLPVNWRLVDEELGFQTVEDSVEAELETVLG